MTLSNSCKYSEYWAVSADTSVPLVQLCESPVGTLSKTMNLEP